MRPKASSIRRQRRRRQLRSRNSLSAGVGGEDVGVFLFFSLADEIVGREEAEFEAVARGAGFAFFVAGARGSPRVSDEVVCVCDHETFLLSGGGREGRPSERRITWERTISMFIVYAVY
jgi:hypothetical protein